MNYYTVSARKLAARCQVNLALGVVTGLSNQEYKDLKATFYQCPELIEQTLVHRDLNFDQNTKDPLTLVKNI